MNEWKDLDIGNIPSDFFVNERYEFGYQFTCDGTWSLQTNLTPLGFIEFMQNNTNTIFRYRLKPLEPIRITEDMALDLCTLIAENAKYKCADHYQVKDLATHYGRPVEIID